MKHRLILTTAELHALHQWLCTEIAVHPSKYEFANLNEHLIWWTLNELEVRLYRRVRLAVPVALATKPHRIAISPREALALFGRLHMSLAADETRGNYWMLELRTFIDQIRSG
jgi:hypothetical protein